MSERDEINRATDLAMHGKLADARAAILELEPRVREPGLRLQLIDVALSVLNNVKDNAKKGALSIEGARIAEATGHIDFQAHCMATTAHLLVLQVGLWHHRRCMLKLAPRWFQFATETDEGEHKSLTTAIDNAEREIDALLAQAIVQSEKAGNKRVQASVLMSMGHIESARYLRYKMDCMRGIRAKLWTTFVILNSPFFEYLLTFSNGDAQKLNTYVRSFINKFLRAAQLSEEINDSLAGYAYYNLAIHLKSAYRFGVAKNYLMKARAIALRHNETVLLPQLDELEKRIQAKNRDVPDYLNGETRNN